MRTIPAYEDISPRRPRQCALIWLARRGSVTEVESQSRHSSCDSERSASGVAAASAAAHPITIPSISELLANRFAPCNPVQATSPIAKSRARSVVPSIPAITPPHW